MATARICSVPDCGNEHCSLGYCNKHYKRMRANGDIELRATPNGAAFRFLTSLTGTTDDACILWPFGKTFAVKFRGRSVIASRVMCFLAHGEPPTPEHEAAHSCGKGHLGCVNQNHLRWATPKENQADRIIHGTHIYGEKVPWAKLTESDVLEIRAAVAKGEPQCIVGARYGMEQYHVSSIVTRRIWKHLP